MFRCIIFDLSEVLIAGLVGIEEELAQKLSVSEDKILSCFAGSLRDELFVGSISEDTYLKQIITRERWEIDIARLKTVIRNNFHNEVEGSLHILMDLASRYELVLLSDHAREWVSYIQSTYPFLKVFEQTFFSYNLKRTKKDPGAFSRVLDTLSLSPHHCLFIDDNPKNVHVAEWVGIPSIHFVNAEQLATDLESRKVLYSMSCQERPK
jgi:FMN phosphatase YigB (HAD superfamily)